MEVVEDCTYLGTIINIKVRLNQIFSRFKLVNEKYYQIGIIGNEKANELAKHGAIQQ